MSGIQGGLPTERVLWQTEYPSMEQHRQLFEVVDTYRELIGRPELVGFAEGTQGVLTPSRPPC